MKFHLTENKFGQKQWLALLENELDYCGIAKSVANVIYKQTFDDPHWAADFVKEKPYAQITHPFKMLPAHYDTFSKMIKKYRSVYINKNGGMSPFDEFLAVLEKANCAYWPTDGITGSISKWKNGSHWYIRTDGISLTAKFGYKEKFNSLADASEFLEKYMPKSAIKTQENFRDFRIGD